MSGRRSSNADVSPAGTSEDSSPWHVARGFAKQKMNLILRLLDLLFDYRDGLSRRVNQLFRLAHVQTRCDASRLPGLHEIERLLPRF
jgi:hypothetical protein